MINCISCKYAANCADYENITTCAGYECAPIPAPAEILEKIKEVRANVETIETARGENERRANELVKALNKTIPRAVFDTEIEKTRAARDEYARRLDHSKNVITILRHNLRISYINAVLAAAPEILGKYDGKPYGPKTREKISAAFKDKTQCAVSIVSGYSWKYSPDMLSIYPLNTHEINYFEICTARDENGETILLLNDNKITAAALSALTVPREKYVSDINGYIEQLKDYETGIIKTTAAANGAIDNYNSFSVLDNNYCHYYVKR